MTLIENATNAVVLNTRRSTGCVDTEVVGHCSLDFTRASIQCYNTDRPCLVRFDLYLVGCTAPAPAPSLSSSPPPPQPRPSPSPSPISGQPLAQTFSSCPSFGIYDKKFTFAYSFDATVPAQESVDSIKFLPEASKGHEHFLVATAQDASEVFVGIYSSLDEPTVTWGDMANYFGGCLDGSHASVCVTDGGLKTNIECYNRVSPCRIRLDVYAAGKCSTAA